MWTYENQQLSAVCDRLKVNDPSETHLDLSAYQALEWTECEQIQAALQRNRVLQELSVYTNRIPADGALCWTHFVRTSLSLTAVAIVEEEEDEGGTTTASSGSMSGTTAVTTNNPSNRSSKQITMEATTAVATNNTASAASKTKTAAVILRNTNCVDPCRGLNTSLLLESIFHRHSLQKITLHEVSFSRPALLERVLTTTQTLNELSLVYETKEFTLATASALRRGLSQNKTLYRFQLVQVHPACIEEVIVGLTEHKSLKVLNLSLTVTVTAAQVLRCLLQSNRVIQDLDLTIRGEPQSKESVVRPILEGLAYSQSLQSVRLNVLDLAPHETTGAWTECLSRSKSMRVLELYATTRERCSGAKLGIVTATAIATGLMSNTVLEKLVFNGNLAKGAFHGPTWQDALAKNRSLRYLGLPACRMGTAGALFLARGMQVNRGIQTLDLQDNDIETAGMVALAQALTKNRVLKALNLACNNIAGPDGGTAVNELLVHNRVLKQLDLRNNQIGQGRGAGRLTEGLSKNKTLERLDLENNTVDSASFLAICDSLHSGNKRLRVLIAEKNALFADDGNKALDTIGNNSSLKVQHAYHGDNQTVATMTTEHEKTLIVILWKALLVAIVALGTFSAFFMRRSQPRWQEPDFISDEAS
jgi:Ran GTPase-activating protein (RanGAP) involved in mRNA processing and transport